MADRQLIIGEENAPPEVTDLVNLLVECAGDVLPLLHTYDARAARLIKALHDAGWGGLPTTDRDSDLAQLEEAIDGLDPKKSGGYQNWSLALRRRLHQRLRDGAADRRPYYTPAEVVDALLRALDHDYWRENGRPQRILEPCAGNGAVIRHMLTSEWGFSPSQFTAIEVNPVEARSLRGVLGPRDSGGDVIAGNAIDECVYGQLGTFDLVVTNPPFALWEQVFRVVWPLVRRGGMVAMLLRSAIKHGQGRREFHLCHRSREYPLDARSAYITDRPKDSDMWDNSWFVWQRPHRGIEWWRPLQVRRDRKANDVSHE